MNCPVCGSTKTKVTRTLQSKSDTLLHFTNIQRTRRCRQCSHWFTTLEIAQPPKEIAVAKKNNKTSTFSYEKLFNSIQKACAGLKIPYEEQRLILVNVVGEITRSIEGEHKTRVLSQEIGTIVMKYLRYLNRVAWLRYVSYFYDDEESIKKSLRQWSAEDSDSVE